MARQNRDQAEITEQVSTEQAETTSEQPSTEQVTPSTEPNAEPKVEEKPIDLTEFVAAVEAVVKSGDAETGELTDEQVESVNVAYRELDGQKAKAAARVKLDEGLMAAVMANEPLTARGYGDLKNKLTAAGGKTTSAPKPPADPTEAYIQRMAALTLGQHVILADFPEGADPEAVNAKVTEAVEANLETLRAQVAYLADTSEDKGDGPELNPLLCAAFKAASGKGGARGRSGGAPAGPRRDVAKHISEVFANVESGTFLTVNEIVKQGTSEYGAGEASQGAVSARLFPTSGKCTVENITPKDKGEVDGKNPKGAVKN